MHLTLSYWKPILEIAILWFVFYRIMLFFEGTRAVQVLRGIIILVVAFFIFQKLDLISLNWLFTKLFAISIIAILIIFQPELRQGLARLGQRNIFMTALKKEEQIEVLKEITAAAANLSQNKIGAIIAIEREDRLKPYIETGTILDSKVSCDLIQTIFTPLAPLHDGALIIQGDRIVAAGCLFPLTEKQDLSRTLGTRHRAAIGLSEISDVLVIVVSEETGNLSLVLNGALSQNLTKEQLFRKIKDSFEFKK